jgi:hypothetical protein
VKVSANTFGRISRGVGKAHRGDAGKLYEMIKARLVRVGASRRKMRDGRTACRTACRTADGMPRAGCRDLRRSLKCMR